MPESPEFDPDDLRLVRYRVENHGDPYDAEAVQVTDLGSLVFIAGWLNTRIGRDVLPVDPEVLSDGLLIPDMNGDAAPVAARAGQWVTCDDTAWVGLLEDTEFKHAHADNILTPVAGQFPAMPPHEVVVPSRLLGASLTLHRVIPGSSILALTITETTDGVDQSLTISVDKDEFLSALQAVSGESFA